MRKIYPYAAVAGLMLPLTGMASVPFEVEPAQGLVSGVHIVQVKLDGKVELTEGCYVNFEEGKYGNAQLNPRFITDAGYAVTNGPTIFCNENFKVVDGNTLYMERAMNLTPATDLLAGSTWFKLWIKGGCYTLDGEPGEDIWVRYVFEEGVWVAEPAGGSALEINNDIRSVEIDFLGQDLSLAEGAETDLSQNIVGQKSMQPVMTFEDTDIEMVFTNWKYQALDGKLVMEFNPAINNPALEEVDDYVVLTVKGDSYFLNGEEGEDIDLTYLLHAGSGIRKVFGEDASLNVTDLQGRQIVRDGKAEDVEGLKGLYIVNGRKVIF